MQAMANIVRISKVSSISKKINVEFEFDPKYGNEYANLNTYLDFRCLAQPN